MKKFIVEKFLNFRMINLRTIINQVQDMLRICLSEDFQVDVIIEKLPLF
jgi:hypothetical protein